MIFAQTRNCPRKFDSEKLKDFERETDQQIKKGPGVE